MQGGSVLLLVGSVIEVRVRLLFLSVRVLRARVGSLLDASPQSPVPGVMPCGVRAGVLGAGSWEHGVSWGSVAYRSAPFLLPRLHIVDRS